MASPLAGTPLRYSAVSASDSIDSTEVFPGAMAELRNLIPMPQTRNYWMCRPAGVEEISPAEFAAAGFTDPGMISASIVIGDLLYGMIATTKNGAGLDAPFCYDLGAGAFIAITGDTAANVPLSPATSGPWVPPTMALVGVDLVITHPGFDGTGTNFVGVIDVTDTVNPTYTSANTATNALTTPPTAVKNFNGRAWYLVNPTTGQPYAAFSDVLDALTITNVSQALTFDDKRPLTAMGLLGLSVLTGGLAQALIVFKGDEVMYQVTGDAVTNNLQKDELPFATGTNAPLSIVSTPKGLAFMTPDGCRVIDFAGQVSDPIGADGSGICAPFIYAVEPSRVVAASHADVVRISVQNGTKIDRPFEEWWFHISRRVWSGPHTLAASQIQRWRNTFVVMPVDHEGSVAVSNVLPSTTDSFLEYGSQLSWKYRTAFLPDPSAMSMFSMVETTINIAYTNDAGNIVASALNQDDSVLDDVIFNAPGTATVWGAFVWGASPWLGALVKLRKKLIPWTQPVVANRMALQLEGDSATGVIMGDWFMRYELLGYTTAELSV